MATCILWNDRLLLNFEPLDEQHKQIFTRIAEIEFLANEDAPKEAILYKLKQLRSEVISHFEYEEALMSFCADSYNSEEHMTSHELVIVYIDYALLATSRSEYREIINGFANELFDAVMQHDSNLVEALILSGKIS